MPRVNFYEILDDLSIDQKNLKVINQSINDWYNNLNTKYHKTTNIAIKNQIKSQMDLKPEMEKVMNDTKLRMQEANEYKEKMKKQVENIAIVLSNEDTKSFPVTNAFIGNIVKKYGLKRMEVVAIFKRHHGEEVNSKNDYFDKNFLKTQIDEINIWINEINKPEVAKKYPWIPENKQINNLYDLMACYNHQPNMNYTSKSTDELYAIANAGDKEYSMKTSLLEGQKLFSKAKIDAFSSDENRRKYNNSLNLMSLDSFFAIANNVPDSMKKDEIFAEAAIKKIQTKFPDYNLALAIYNQKLGLIRDPYEAKKSSILVYCGHCHTSTPFASASAAMNSQCPVCGKPFYKKCPSCGKLIPSSSKICSNCHLDLIEYQNFDHYYHQASIAMQNLNLNEAKLYINKAKIANPKSSQIIQLENNLTSLQKQYDAPLKQLQNYMNNHEYLTANQYINNLKKQYPKLNLDYQQKTAQTAINNAKVMFNQKGTNTYETANNCVRILRMIKDFPEAKAYLDKVSPRPVSVLNSSVNQQGVSLNWNASQDIGVTYVLVRNSQHRPMNISDGFVIEETDTRFSFLDRGIESGLTYYYALFVKRGDNYSTPATTSITLYNEIDKNTLNYMIDGQNIRFQWTLPKHALGIRILRCQGGSVDINPNANTICVATKASNSFIDNQIEKGKMYQYRFQVIYQASGREVCTNGIVCDVLNEEIPKPSTITQAKYDETLNKIIFHIQSSTTKSYKIQVINLEKPFGHINDTIDVSQIPQYGKIVAIGETTNTQLNMSALKNTNYYFGIITIVGNKAILGNTSHISTTAHLDIDKTKTKIINKRLHIHLNEPIATNVTNIFYACKVKQTSNSKPPYLTVNDINEMRQMTITQYQKQHSIIIDAIPERELYITVIAQMNDNGKTYYGEPAKLYINNNKKATLIYDIGWQGTFKKKRTGATLRISNKGRPLKHIDDWPILYLVARTDGRIPKQYKVKGAVVVARVDERSYTNHSLKINDSGDFLYITFDVPNNIPSKASLRLFLDEYDADEFELQPINEKTLMVP